MVAYDDNGCEHTAMLTLEDDLIAQQVTALLDLSQGGDREAALDLYACLHAQWGKARVVRRHPAWDAIFRYLATLAVGAVA